MQGTFLCFCYCLLIFFSKLTFSKASLRKTTKVSNSLDPDQDQHSVGPDLGPNCFLRLSADYISRDKQGRVKELLVAISANKIFNLGGM